MRMLGVAAVSILALGAASGAQAQEHTLRIQTHFSAESLNGQNAAQFVNDVETMSGGRIKIEMFYSSSVVKSTETFDAAVSGVLDGDMTGGAYQTGKNAAFQFVGDIMGGYNTPWEQYSWLYYGGGMELAQELYNAYEMQLIGWWIPGQETMSSTSPLAGPADLKDWKFRSPPGLETEIFAEMGASPIVMDFGEIFTALETGIIDGADASNITTNESLGLYDLAEHATYPGFHSMPSDHLALNKEVWDGLPDDLKRIIEVAMEKLSFRNSLSFQVATGETASNLAGKGITLYDWSAEDRTTFREAAQAKWQEWGDKTPEARALVDSHIGFMNRIGLLGGE